MSPYWWRPWWWWRFFDFFPPSLVRTTVDFLMQIFLILFLLLAIHTYMHLSDITRLLGTSSFPHSAPTKQVRLSHYKNAPLFEVNHWLQKIHWHISTLPTLCWSCLSYHITYTHISKVINTKNLKKGILKKLLVASRQQMPSMTHGVWMHHYVWSNGMWQMEKGIW